MPTRPPFTALSGRFLKRTLLATLLTLALVAMTGAAYGYPRWAGVYLASGVWALVFLALTPLIIKAMMFDRRPALGLALIAFKFCWLGLVFWAFVHGNRAGASARLPGSALIAGVTTPLAVIVLRAMGGALTPPPDRENTTAKTPSGAKGRQED